MGMIKGVANGIGAVFGGIIGLRYSGFAGIVAGAFLGTVITDAIIGLAGGNLPTGRIVGILKGIAAVSGSVAPVVLPTALPPDIGVILLEGMALVAGAIIPFLVFIPSFLPPEASFIAEPFTSESLREVYAGFIIGPFVGAFVGELLFGLVQPSSE